MKIGFCLNRVICQPATHKWSPHMRIFSVLLALPLITLIACGGGEEPAVLTEAPANEVVAEAVVVEEVAVEEVAFDAAATFAISCASCHGATGAGDGAAAGALPVTPANFSEAIFWETRTDEAVASVIRDGGAANGKSPLMVAFGPMLGDNVPAMVAYLHTLSDN
jgi:mono/diheme cytochrome c family protein